MPKKFFKKNKGLRNAVHRLWTTAPDNCSVRSLDKDLALSRTRDKIKSYDRVAVKNFFTIPLPNRSVVFILRFMKKCIQCKKFKPLKDFYDTTPNSVGKTYKRGRCNKCHSKKTADNYRKNPEVRHMSKIKKLYGISREEYNSLLKKQNGKCAICELAYDESLCVDHDHKTGKVRGLLCHNCNRAIGLLKDSATRAVSAALYLS